MATQLRVIQVACYSRELAGRFWRLVSKWKVQSWGVHRDFHGSACDSLASETSSREKHLANFSKSLGLKCFGGCPWQLVSVVKNTCFAFQRQFLKLFQFFPRIFVTVHYLPHFSLNWNWLKHSVSHFSNSIFASFKKKVWVFFVSLDFFMFWELFSWFLGCHCGLRYTVFEHVFA